jgi:hypothetical protein
VRIFKVIGTKELDYLSRKESISKVLNREARKHRHNSNELVGDLIQMNYSLFPEIEPIAKNQFEASENNSIIHLRTSRAFLKRLG